jgi:capsid protein
MDLLQGQYTALGYDSARRTGVRASGGSERRHQDVNREQVINQSRQFVRDNEIYQGVVGMAARHIVGDGWRLQVNTGDASWDRRAQDLWQEYWRAPDVTGLRHGPGLEDLLAREVFTCGESVTVLGPDGLLQMVESEQLTRGLSRDKPGIATDSVGRPSAYYIAPYSTAGVVRGDQAQPYPPQYIAFVSQPARPSGLRGMPPLQAAFPMLHRIADVLDSEAIAWQTLARFVLAITRAEGPGFAGLEGEADDGADSGDLADRVSELGYAIAFQGKPGEEIKGIERNIPGSNFGETMRSFLRMLGLPVGLPLELVLLDWSQANYSQSRAILEQADVVFRRWKSLMRHTWYDRIVAWKLGEWMADRKTRLGKRDISTRPWGWITPQPPWIDLLKEVQAHGAKLDRGIGTFAEACRAQGMEPDEVLGLRRREVDDAIKMAADISRRNGVDVPWQIFAGLTADGSGQQRETTEGMDRPDRAPGGIND